MHLYEVQKEVFVMFRLSYNNNNACFTKYKNNAAVILTYFLYIATMRHLQYTEGIPL